ncbi:MAG TPA: transcriptional repressor LexA [Nevskiaceae bacterium]|nr:transcriptional repressor LexA [Nevskiaceae bacterium]
MLTPRQAQILQFIQTFLAENGTTPTRAEIVTEFGFASPTAAEDHLRALEKKGALELVPGAARNIRLREGGGHGLAVIGRVAAGSPILAVENVERRVSVAADLFKPRADYLLRVRGESMRDAGIHDGDLLAVHRTETARNGQVVVARLGDDVTVKRFERRGDVVRLLPENPDFEPIRVDLAKQPLVIEGLAVGLLRAGI